jgi:hypothetical protein
MFQSQKTLRDCAILALSVKVLSQIAAARGKPGHRRPAAAEARQAG